MERSTSTATTTTAGPPDVITPLVEYFRTADFFGAWTQDIGALLGQVWFGYTIFAYLLSFGLLYMFLYASIRFSRLKETLEAGIAAQREAYAAMHEQSTHQTRWDGVLRHVDSSNPNDWKLAIIEADIMLDEFLKQSGYTGTSLGERLKNISRQSMQTLDEAWEAHKVRNQIAHGGVDFVLTQKLARDTISRYRSVFMELGII